MKTALIGYSGFVGGNIAAQSQFDILYNSKNIAAIEGQQYDLVVSAANRADMWRINQQAKKDLAEINEFIDHIKKAEIKKLVLISTAAVYKKTAGVDEDSPIKLDGLPPYGANRYHLEKICAQNFDTTIIRLPGLFGKGLKKNAIYDLLHNNQVERIHWAAKYQYYNLDNIWRDIKIALNNKLTLVNFATEPVQTKEMAEYCFGIKDFDNEPEGIKPAAWDIHSKYTKLFGGQGFYLYSKTQELRDIKSFVKHERARL